MAHPFPVYFNSSDRVGRLVLLTVQNMGWWAGDWYSVPGSWKLLQKRSPAVKLRWWQPVVSFRLRLRVQISV